MDSTGTLDLLGCKVFILLTNCCAGGLPVSVIITTIEDEDAVTEGLKMMQEMTPEPESLWYGRGQCGPLAFMTDNSAIERATLLKVFPEARLLLCHFHIP